MQLSFETLENRYLLDGGFQHGGLDHLPRFDCDVTSVASGEWSDPAVWSGAPGGDVCIRAGDVVVYASVDAVLDSLSVSGSLVFRRDQSTRLTVGTMVVMPEGSLTASPIPSVTTSIVFRDQPIDLQHDPEQFSVGLIGLGVINLRGAEKESFVEPRTGVSSGTSKIGLDHAPVGWRVGDTVVLPASGAGSQTEERIIASIAGSNVVLDRPLTYAHPGNGGFMPHLANITRNVVLRSENPDGVRGHTMFVHRADVDIAYSEFSDLGRTTVQPLDSTTFAAGGSVSHVGTNQVGRYSLHLHHIYGPIDAGSYQYRIVGNSIHDTNKWGMAIHDSHFGLVQGNVVYAAQGAGIVTEDASETGNVIERNMVVGVTGVQDTVSRKPGDGTPFVDFGHEGAGFWFRGANNYVRDNIAADTRAGGFVYYVEPDPGQRHIPLFPGADTTVVGQYRLGQSAIDLEFANNEAYAGRSGLEISFVGDLKLRETFVVGDFSAWNTRHAGVDNLYSVGKIRFDGLRIVFQPGNTGKPTIGFENASSRFIQLTLNDVDIRNADQDFS